MSLCPLQPTINFISPSIIYCLSVYFYSLQWEFHSFQGFSKYSYAHLPSSLSCLVNSLAISDPICSNWRIASSSTVVIPQTSELEWKCWLLFMGRNNLQLSLTYSFYGSSIPPAFGNLTNLSYLNLSNAGFEISRLTIYFIWHLRTQI